MALLGGDVAAHKTLTRAVGAVTASQIGSAIGAYNVVFDRNVATFLYSVTPYQASIAYAQTRFDNDSAVFVQMFDRSGTQANGRFHLIVFCGR